MTENTPNNTAPAGLHEAQRPAPAKGGSRVQKRGTGKTVALGIAIGLCVVALLAAGLGIYAAYGYDRVYPGVRVEGVGLQGLDEEQTYSRVTALLDGRSPAHSFLLTVGGTVFTIDVSAQDMGYDAQATAQAVWQYGRQGSLFARIGAIVRALNGGASVEPVFIIRPEGITRQAEDIARDTQQSIIQAAYEFDGQRLIVDRGQAGTSLSAETLSAFVMEKLEAGDFSDVTYPMSQEEPDALDLLLIKQQVESDYQEASLDLENDPTGGTVIPARAGVRLDLTEAQQALDATDERFVEIPVRTVQPKYTTEAYTAMVFRDILGAGTTEFNPNLKGRTTNVLLANGFVDSTILLPGETFSYNDTVGPRTYERGFKDAIVYVGTSAEDGVGGGICQVSSTIYYACLRADLEIVERRSHSRMVTYVPLGEDATVAWGSTDYKFRNNTDFPIKIVTSNTNNTITIELWGTQLTANKEVKLDTARLSHTPFETVYVEDPSLPLGAEKVDQTGYTGYRTETYRVVYIDGKEVSRTFENKSAYTKYDKVVLRNTGATATDPAATDPGATDPTAPVVSTDPTQPTDPGTEGPTNYDDGTTTPTRPEVTEPETPTEPQRTEPEVTEPEVTAPPED